MKDLKWVAKFIRPMFFHLEEDFRWHLTWLINLHSKYFLSINYLTILIPRYIPIIAMSKIVHSIISIERIEKSSQIHLTNVFFTWKNVFAEIENFWFVYFSKNTYSLNRSMYCWLLKIFFSSIFLFLFLDVVLVSCLFFTVV